MPPLSNPASTSENAKPAVGTKPELPAKPGLPSKPGALKGKPALPTKPLFLNASTAGDKIRTPPLPPKPQFGATGKPISHSTSASPVVAPPTPASPASVGSSGYRAPAPPLTKPGAPPLPSRDHRALHHAAVSAPAVVALSDTSTTRADSQPPAAPLLPPASTDIPRSRNTRSLIAKFSGQNTGSDGNSEDILTPILEAQSKKFPKFQEAGPHDLSPHVPDREVHRFPRETIPRTVPAFEDVPLHSAAPAAPPSRTAAVPGSAASRGPSSRSVAPPALPTRKPTINRSAPPAAAGDGPPPLPSRSSTQSSTVSDHGEPTGRESNGALHRSATMGGQTTSRFATGVDSDYEPIHAGGSSLVRSTTLSPNSSTEVGRPASSLRPAITRLARRRYEELFRQSDTDKDQFLTKEEAKQIFLKSRLGHGILGDIW
ncbi:hypothetical protein IWQ60_011545 [Tieghemiomyces parasiticus]|uniref:EF-hand domain-containing protein n=1 Tax=Tieghemiomyces parasiticus TaxID=78921 RepID=A0A9W7ZRR2_9FUNG|nr:hypothetical protein IWQ60_011545 [Tieghemiomyces parasiticus]